MPTKSQRAMYAAVPYMLEDELGQDVEQLFFAYDNVKDESSEHNCFVAIVEHAQIQAWQSWLADANIYANSMQVDVLAMPLIAGQWSAVAMSGSESTQIILRQGRWQGMTLDAQAWQFAAQHIFTKQQASDEQDSQTNITAYSALPESEQLNIRYAEEELPLALLAQHSDKNSFNLLQGRYQVKTQHSKALTSWLWAAGIAACALLLNVGYKSAQLWQINAQQAQVEEQIISRYKQVFPRAKKVRIGTIKSQLNRKIAELGGSSDSDGFLAMLAKVQPAFAKVPELKPESLKFDGKRQELRLQAVANDYQHFERFKNALNDADLVVKQGAQSNQGEQISGSYSISSSNNRPAEKNTKGRS